MPIDPNTLPASFIQAQAYDPARGSDGPPNFGRPTMPHIFTIGARYGLSARAYQWADEAMRHDKRNAEAMRKETCIMECLEGRQRATALLKWHVQAEDTKSRLEAQMCSVLTDILERIPRFTELRRVLQEALWYGRYATAHTFERTRMRGEWRTKMKRWEPRNGDKLVFRFDDGTFRQDSDQVGIRVGAGYTVAPDTTVPFGIHRRKVEATQYGLVRWFDRWERQTIAVHKHMVEDGPFDDAQRSGSIHGVGIRDRIYWTWYGMQECLAHMLEYLERTALGIEIWHYPANNPQAEERTRQAAEQRIGGGRSIVLVPVFPGEQADLFGVQHIEPGLGGVDALKDVIQNYFGGKIKRYILGQTLTTEAEATGLGSGVSDAHLATFADIITYDAINLQETITEDILRPLQLWNFHGTEDIYLRFVIDTESDDAQAKMAAYYQSWQMGLKIKAEDLRSIIGASKPSKDDETLENPQTAGGGMMAGGMPGMPGAGPPGMPGAGPKPQPEQQETEGEEEPEGPQQNAQQEMYGQSYAERIERAVAEVETPSDAQRESGNYRKGHVTLHGLRITIENPKGTTRRPEWKPLAAHYGYVRGTEGRDGDHVDVFIGPCPESEIVFVVDQVAPSGRFDEHKAVIGCSSESEARELYLANYQSGWRCGPITAMTIKQFRAWLEKGDQRKRVESQVSRYGVRYELARALGIRVDRYKGVKDLEFEKKHDRDEDGKFTSGHGKSVAAKSEMTAVSRQGKGKESRIVMGDGSPAPEWVKPSMIPPAWSDVKIAVDPESDVLVEAKDAKGRSKRVYSDRFTSMTAAKKFSRVRDCLVERDAIEAQNQKNRSDPSTKDSADCTWLMLEQATRPGSESDTKGLSNLYGIPITRESVEVKDGKKKGVSLSIGGKSIPIRDAGAAAEIQRRLETGEALEDSTYWLNSYGATTLEARHVVHAEDGVRLKFMGKEGVWHDHKIRDPALAEMLLERKGSAEGDSGKLFPGTNYAKVSGYAKTLGSGSYTPKDWRTSFATGEAKKLVEGTEFSGDKKKHDRATLEVAKRVSGVLGNRAAQALESYIDPSVFAKWKDACSDC